MSHKEFSEKLYKMFYAEFAELFELSNEVSSLPDFDEETTTRMIVTKFVRSNKLSTKKELTAMCLGLAAGFRIGQTKAAEVIERYVVAALTKDKSVLKENLKLVD